MLWVTAMPEAQPRFADEALLSPAPMCAPTCRHLSKESSWLPGELEANLALGIVYEELGDVTVAIACHERRLELAAESGATVREWLREWSHCV